MKRCIALMLILTFASFAFAEFDTLPADIKANLNAVQKYPLESNLLLWVQDSYALNDDGSQVYERHEYRWIPDESARDAYGDPHVAYIDGRQKLDILVARAYTRDGRKVDSTPNNAFNSIVPENGMDKAPDYTSFRQMVITLLGLENGCVAELHYRLTTTKPQLPWMEGRIYSRETYPVIARELIVQIPASAKLIYRSDRGAPEPTVQGTTYTWKFGEQRGYLQEDLRGHVMLIPNVAFTTAKDWTQVSEEFRTRIATALTGDVIVPASLQDNITAATSDEARLDVIKSWVRERFNHLEFEHSEFPLTLRPVAQILNSGYGNSLEMAVLVTKLAETAGIHAQVVPMFLPDAPVPSLTTLHNALLNVKLDGLRFYCDPLDPRSEFTQADMLGAFILDGDPETVEPVEFKCRAKSPYVNLSLALDDLGADTLHGKGTLHLYGEWGAYEKVRADGAREFVAGFVSINGMEIDDVSIKSLEPSRINANVEVDFSFSAAALDTMEGRVILPLALMDYAVYAGDASFSLLSREFPQWIPLPGTIQLHVEAPVPDGWIMESKPSVGKQMWDWSEGETRCEIKNERFVFNRELKLAREWIAPDGWKGFRSWILDAGKRTGNAAVFKTK